MKDRSDETEVKCVESHRVTHTYESSKEEDNMVPALNVLRCLERGMSQTWLYSFKEVLTFDVTHL